MRNGSVTISSMRREAMDYHNNDFTHFYLKLSIHKFCQFSFILQLLFRPILFID